jgi:hypothetical protein
MLDFAALLKKKEADCRMSEKQQLPGMPRANISVPKLDRLKQFFEDREYDDTPVKVEGMPTLSKAMDMVRAEQCDEYMHRDDNIKTFNMINETNNTHPYDVYFQRKREDEHSNC